MKYGALAFLDCLGFKGTWKRNDPAQVLRILKKIAELTNESIADLHASVNERNFPWDIKVQSAFISDTIVIAAWLENKLNQSRESVDDATRTLGDGWLVTDVARRASYAMSIALESQPLLAYRGFITLGEFELDGTFLIGPAIDEAAEHYEQADGSFVWLSPKASYSHVFTKQVVRTHLETGSRLNKEPAELTHALENAIVDKYSVPMKGGRYLTVSAVNPLAMIKGLESQERAATLLIDSMESSSLDIWAKQQNTAHFLNRCLQPFRPKTGEGDG